jgi:hypothetical protein
MCCWLRTKNISNFFLLAEKMVDGARFSFYHPPAFFLPPLLQRDYLSGLVYHEAAQCSRAIVLQSRQL